MLSKLYSHVVIGKVGLREWVAAVADTQIQAEEFAAKLNENVRGFASELAGFMQAVDPNFELLDPVAYYRVERVPLVKERSYGHDS